MKSNFSAILLIIISILSCQNQGPQPLEMVGSYEVSFRIKDNAIDKVSIKNKIKEAMQNADDEIRKAKKDLDNEFDLHSIDTFTTEGKMEYAAKKFGKSMAEVGINLGDLGKNMGSALSGLAIDGVDFSESILKNTKIKIELKADGDVKSKGSFLNFGFSNAKWEVRDDEFIFSNNDGKDHEILKISNKTKDGFTLEKDNVYLDFVKKLE
ncbi:MAG: hypothetical protein IPO98_21485 [Saprospiraceae bacterium]|nr:hypothetical protein [Saprospiraceae bacterium]